MDTFQEYYADIRDPAQHQYVTAQLRERGLVTFSGIADRVALTAVARRLMTIRPHRDADPDGVTVISDTRASGAGYAAFTDAGLAPHTDGSSLPDPPGLLLIACQQPAAEGGETLAVDGARVIGTLAERHPAALRSLSAPLARSHCCAQRSGSTGKLSGCVSARVCCSATPAGCTAGTATPAGASCSVSSVTHCPTPASRPDFRPSRQRPAHRQHRRRDRRDLLGSGNELIHVKRARGSAPLSPLSRSGGMACN